MNPPMSKLGRLAVRIGAATLSQVEECLELQASGKQGVDAQGQPLRLGDILAARGYITQRQLATLLKSQETSYQAGQTPQLSSTLGNFELLKSLGMETDREAFKARQRETGELYILRVFHPLAGQEASAFQFAQDIKRAGTLRHKNLCRIIMCGKAEGRYFYAMEYTEGASLRKIIEASAPMAPGAVAGLAAMAAQALDYAHGRGICHQVLRPSAIIVDTDGIAKVMGIGIAREPVRSLEKLIGASGAVPAYIAPEQASETQSAPDPRSDLFSLGAILYHMATGHPPYKGASVAEVLLSIAEAGEPPNPAAEIQGFPANLAAAIRKLIMPDMEMRCQSARELLDNISGIPAEPLRPL